MRILLVTNLYPTPDRPTYGSFVEEQVRSLVSRGLEVEVLHLLRPGRRTRYLWGPIEIARAERRFRPDLIHAHYGLTGALAVLRPTVPVVVTYHGSDVTIPWQRRISRFAARRAAANLLVSERQRPLLDAPRMHVVPCGVDPERFHPRSREEARAKLQLDSGEPWILFAGAFDNPVKNYPLLEAALARTPQRSVRVKEMTGMARSDVAWWMAAVDVLVLTSHHEGSPMVVKEALFCGLPVLGTPVGDLPERIGGITGCRIVEPNPAAVRAGLDDILARRERLVVSDGNLAELRLDRIAERLESIYHDVLRV